jgi:SAM-dependent methyltransferase
MLPAFETSSFKSLTAEQEVVQATKFQGRLLEEYSRYIFPGQTWRTPRSTEVTDFLRPLCLDERVSLDGVIQGLCELKGEDSVRWVDMGGGRGLPMRQLANDTEKSSHLVMTNVDLFDYGLDELNSNEINQLEKLAPGMTHEAAAPYLIQADIETVVLPEPADLITSVESMQYVNNPLAAMSNWYNQLADDGLMVISTEHDWTSWMRYKQAPGAQYNDITPAHHLLATLKEAGVAYAATTEIDFDNGVRPKLDPNRVSNLVVKKLPGTQMVVNSSVSEVWVSPYSYKAVYYEEPTLTESLVEIIRVAS